jgi:hypothetical protein
MKAILCLLFLIFIYFQIIKWCPFEIACNYHYYFYGFIAIYIIIYYFMSYQKQFVYKMFTNLQDTDSKPLYDINSTSYKENKTNGLKYNLAMKQGWRCMGCQNPILQKDIFNHSIHYIQPLQFGGQNNINNIGIKCDTCTNFSPY